MASFIAYRQSVSVACLSFLFALSLPITACAAESYPERPVRVIVPFAAGGPSDVLGRTIAAGLTSAMGQTFFVDNRGGSGGNIGATAAARSPADGYTLLLGSVATHGINKALYSNLQYDPVKDFAPVSFIASLTNIMVLNPSFAKSNGINTVGDFLGYARAHAGSINAASAGNGSSSHLAIELLNTMTDIRLIHVPYRGSGPALLDLIAGNCDLMFDSPLSTLPYIKDGKLKALAVSSAQRSPAFPELPAVGETPELKGYEVDTWWALFAPAGTPPSIVDKLQAAMVKVLNDPVTKDRLVAQGATPRSSTPAELAALVQADIARWSKLIEASGIKKVE